MTYAADDVRRDLLEAIGEAVDQLAAGVAALGGAYDLLDETAGDLLEAELFRPLQLAYGRLQRTATGFADRFGLEAPAFSPATQGAPSHGVAGFVELAREAVEEADGVLSSLQDSMMPVDVGDAELRAGLAEVRRLIGEVPGRAASFMSGFGR